MASYCDRNLAEQEEHVLKGNIGLRKLLRGGGLLPSPRTRESPSIARKDLNAYSLTKLGRIRIEWSTDITEHLTLKHEYEKTSLMLFSLPCILGQHSTLALRYSDLQIAYSLRRLLRLSSTVGISNELQYEITMSYGLLFGRFPDEHSRRWIPGTWMCKCIGCKVAGVLEETMIAIENTDQVLDPSLWRHCREMKPACNVWVPSDFKHFWTRIHDLNQFLQERKPRSLVQLFKDRRDTLQYYTFWCVPALDPEERLANFEQLCRRYLSAHSCPSFTCYHSNNNGNSAGYWYMSEFAVCVVNIPQGFDCLVLEKKRNRTITRFSSHYRRIQHIFGQLHTGAERNVSISTSCL